MKSNEIKKKSFQQTKKQVSISGDYPLDRFHISKWLDHSSSITNKTYLISVSEENDKKKVQNE